MPAVTEEITDDMPDTAGAVSEHPQRATAPEVIRFFLLTGAVGLGVVGVPPARSWPGRNATNTMKSKVLVECSSPAGPSRSGTLTLVGKLRS